MKIFNKLGSWIDKLDTKIFGNEGYQPLAGQGFVMSLKVSIAVGVVLFAVQLFTTGQAPQQWVVGIGFIFILAAMAMKTLPNFVGQAMGIGAKIGYGFFCLVLTTLALQLAMWIVMLLLVLLVLNIIFFFTGIGKPGKSYKLTHPNGSTEIVESWRGPLGEENIDVNGTSIDPDDPRYRK